MQQLRCNLAHLLPSERKGRDDDDDDDDDDNDDDESYPPELFNAIKCWYVCQA